MDVQEAQECKQQAQIKRGSPLSKIHESLDNLEIEEKVEETQDSEIFKLETEFEQQLFQNQRSIEQQLTDFSNDLQRDLTAELKQMVEDNSAILHEQSNTYLAEEETLRETYLDIIKKQEMELEELEECRASSISNQTLLFQMNAIKNAEAELENEEQNNVNLQLQQKGLEIMLSAKPCGGEEIKIKELKEELEKLTLDRDYYVEQYEILSEQLQVKNQVAERIMNEKVAQLEKIK